MMKLQAIMCVNLIKIMALERSMWFMIMMLDTTLYNASPF